MNLTKAFALMLVTCGTILILWHGYSIAGHSFIAAKVLSVDPYQGECRIRIGKYLPCARYRAVVSFLDPQTNAPRTAMIEAGEGEHHVAPGSSIKVMVRPDAPDVPKLASISEGWALPLGIFFFGALVLLVQSISRRGETSLESSAPKS